MTRTTAREICDDGTCALTERTSWAELSWTNLYMVPRLSAAFASRLPASFSFAFFSTTASSSTPSDFQRRKMSIKQLVDVRAPPP